MEDNEFEEVTIISHTDHGTSVLPQSTAERLMKEIKLEVTQKISQNENVKLGSLQHSTTPTLLDSIYQNGFGTVANNRSVSFFSPHRWDGYEKQFLMGYGNFTALLKDGVTTQQYSLNAADGNALISYVLPWGEHYFVFPTQKCCHILDKNFNLVKTTKSVFMGLPSWHVVATNNYLYYLNFNRSVTRVDPKLQEVVICSEHSSFDFSVDLKTDEVCTLSDSGIVERYPKRVILNPKQPRAKFFRIKHTYSNTYIVAEMNNEEDKNIVHLIHSKKLQLMNSIALTSKCDYDYIRNFHLCVPRFGVEAVLCSTNKQIQLLVISGKKMNLGPVIDSPVEVESVASIWDDTIVVGGNQIGHRSFVGGMCLIKLTWPKWF